MAIPCCGIKSIDRRTKMVTVTEKATACTYEFQAQGAKDLEGLKVGGSIELDVKQLSAVAQPKSGQVSSTAQAATSGSNSCGSNVPRDANTTTCWVRGDGDKWVAVPCTK